LTSLHIYVSHNFRFFGFRQHPILTVPTNIIFHWRQIGHAAQEPIISAVRPIREAIFITLRQAYNIYVKYSLAEERFVHVMTSCLQLDRLASCTLCTPISSYILTLIVFNTNILECCFHCLRYTCRYILASYIEVVRNDIHKDFNTHLSCV